MYSDFLIIRKMKQGDDTAFDLFVRKYYQNILDYCCYHCHDKTYAEDLTQETFIRFFTKLSDYHYRGKTLNYLYTIAGNLCKDFLRKQKDILVEEMNFMEEHYLQEHKLDNVLNKIMIEQTLQELPDELSEVLELYYFHGLKQTDIASKLQIGLPLVKYRLGQGKKQMKELLGKEDNDELGKGFKDV